MADKQPPEVKTVEDIKKQAKRRKRIRPEVSSTPNFNTQFEPRSRLSVEDTQLNLQEYIEGLKQRGESVNLKGNNDRRNEIRRSLEILRNEIDIREYMEEKVFLEYLGMSENNPKIDELNKGIDQLATRNELLEEKIARQYGHTMTPEGPRLQVANPVFSVDEMIEMDDTRFEKSTMDNLKSKANSQLKNILDEGKLKPSNFNVENSVDTVVSMFAKANASGAGSAFVANLGRTLFQNNVKAAQKFFRMFASNPIAGLQMAGKGLLAMSIEGLPATAALAVMMPTPVNDDEEELLASVMEDPQQNYIDAVLDQHRDKNFVQRILLPELSPAPIIVDGQPATHMMSAEFMGANRTTPAGFPMIVARDEGLVQLTKEEAMDEARRTGNYIPFESIESANTFSKIYKGGENSKFNKFYNGKTAAEKMFGVDTPDGVNENYAKNFLPSVRNEFDYDMYPTSEYTTDTTSPEFKGLAKVMLDKYFATNPEELSVDLANGLFGQKERSALNTMTALRNNDGSYKIVDRYNINQNPFAEFDTVDVAQTTAASIENLYEGAQGWVANQMTDDDIIIDIDIPTMLPVVSDQVDAPYAFENGVSKPRFNNAPLTYDRHQNLTSMLNIIIGDNSGEDTSMDTQGRQEPEGGIERSGSEVVQTGDTQTAS